MGLGLGKEVADWCQVRLWGFGGRGGRRGGARPQKEVEGKTGLNGGVGLKVGAKGLSRGVGRENDLA